MDLKKFQRRVVDELERYLRALAAEREKGNLKHAAKDAWEDLKLGRYEERRNGLGEDLPSFCIKVPTGGGKTLIATQALGHIHRILLPERNGAGLVLWVVPSGQIYRDTIRRLSDRTDMYRIMLEHAVSRRIEVWEKHQIMRLSPVRLRDCLNILVVQLASTNRETKEQLKFFRDSGGAIVDHFPPENDPAAQRKLKELCPNLDMIEDDADTGRHLIATSVGNLVRLCRPAVIVDEGHKATSQLAQETIEGFNASIVVELSATPHKGANIVSRVSGEELLDEEMIKLPLNVKTSRKRNWTDLMTEARDKRVALARAAQQYQSEGGPPIRPIVLVQVQRTGKEQRAKGYIHSEDVREHLRQKLNVPDAAIKVKSSSTDELENLDLMDPESPVEWIITKSALQEGWDCPFAYILVSLNNTGSARAMTQLVGRVLRQPHQKRSEKHPELNESYAYCLHDKPKEILKHVKAALEKEGYEGDAESLVRDESKQGDSAPARVTRWRDQFRDLYTKPFEGKIFLPRFCVKRDGGFEPLDYFRHLVSQVNVDKFAYKSIDWPLADEAAKGTDSVHRVTLGEGPKRQSETEVDFWESDEHVLSWLIANLDLSYLSHKQLRRIVERVHKQIVAQELNADQRMASVKTALRRRIAAFIGDQVDNQTERVFRRMFDNDEIVFYLRCEQCRFEMPESITLAHKGGEPPKRLRDDDDDELARSLFDFVDRREFNDLERQVALVLDRDVNVLWWYRNLVGEGQFAIQGYKRNRIYPDFVAQSDPEGRALHQVVVVESKGEHLEGNRDTTYKRDIAKFFERAGKRVSWQQLGEDFKNHQFRFQVLSQAQIDGQEWEDELRSLLASDR
ncbi:MAG: DEAD/DEAH box helicase [Phycisphaerales bacterium JB054]